MSELGKSSSETPEATLGVETLTEFTVSPCGTCVRLGLVDAQGGACGLVLPFRCLGMLLMTLPKVIERAIQAQSSDPAMRHVFQLDSWSMEAEVGGFQLIVGLSAGDGFEGAVRHVRSGCPGDRRGAMQSAELLVGSRSRQDLN